tara:strand:+ start:294 stop:1217 length:924 start_codon:yes stop_codon:yes gene_type:complete
MKIALTGITGMVGSHLIKKLVNDGQNDVRALIRETSILEHLKPYEDVDYIIGDLENKESLSKLVDGAETVIHLAHFPGPAKTPDELVKANVNGSFELLEAAKQAKIKKFIFMSSASIFGEILPTVEAENPLDESHPVRPGGLYGSIKASIEAFCMAYKKMNAFDINILRPVTIYGVRPDLPKSEWFQTIDYLATNYNVDLKGSTKYVSVDATVQAISKILETTDSNPIYHLVDGHIHNLDLGKLIADTIDSFGEAMGEKGTEGIPMSNQKAKELGVEFKGVEGIKEYIKLIHRLQVEFGGERSVQNW